MYHDTTLYMLSLYKESKSINVLKDFFAQLAEMDQLDIFPIINAISAPKKELACLIQESIHIKPWMHKISLEDIRNVIVFLLWRDYKVMCTLEDYIPDNREVDYLKKPSNGFTDNLIHLLQSCFYVRQIYHIKNFNLTDNWDRFIPWLHTTYHKHGLKKTVYELCLLIIPLHQSL